MAVALSEAAAKQVKELKQAQNLPETVFLRMGVKGGGCSGMSYALEFDSEVGPHDKSFVIDGIKVVGDDGKVLPAAREVLKECAAQKLVVETGHSSAAEALAIFCYRVKQAIGGFAAALGGLDTVVFSGGIGEQAAEIRARILEGLEFLGIVLDDGLDAFERRARAAHAGGGLLRAERFGRR